MIPIFDSLLHPTLTGRFLSSPADTSFSAVSQRVRDMGFRAGCAVGMAGVENYSHTAFLEACRAHDNLVPIAGLGPVPTSALRDEVAQIREMGFHAVKIHPRFSKLDITGEWLPEAMKAASAVDLPVFYCTYQFCQATEYPSRDPFLCLIDALRAAPKARVLLMHGGGVELLKYAELVRANENLTLDLSLTFLKYRSSSIDLDVRFLFEKFDRRVTIGSDFPDFAPDLLSRGFEESTAGLPPEKIENIAYRNLEQLLLKP